MLVFSMDLDAAITSYLVAMVPKEYEVPLIVECDHSTSLELRIMRKEGGKHTSHGLAESSVEIIENDFWHVTRRVPRPFDLRLRVKNMDTMKYQERSKT